jgi:Flp pilus assembly protein protease CpaA
MLCQLAAVAWIDLRSKKISNYWPLINIVLATGLHVLDPHFQLSWQLLLFPVGFIVIGFLLFLAGIMGAGDSKYLASLFLCLPTEQHFIFFERLIECTIVVGLINLALKVGRGVHWQGWKNLVKSNFSYAPVILLAWIFLGIRLWT